MSQSSPNSDSTMLQVERLHKTFHAGTPNE
ncbi:ABC transporter ATP-binding protein, partial [Pseudomonas sp. GW460-13]